MKDGEIVEEGVLKTSLITLKIHIQKSYLIAVRVLNFST